MSGISDKGTHYTILNTRSKIFIILEIMDYKDVLGKKVTVNSRKWGRVTGICDMRIGTCLCLIRDDSQNFRSEGDKIVAFRLSDVIEIVRPNLVV